MSRLAKGGLIDRGKTLRFSFDGKAYCGFAGDTLASALLANDVALMGLSFKYHRPRGLLTAGSDEPNALVELRRGVPREPNTKVTTAELFEGLEAESQNRFPSLKFDLLSVNNLLSPFLTAGFYYKSFMWPASWWEKVYEPAIRRAAGLGRASGEADPDAYEKAHAFCDVLVAGSGPPGLMAAIVAARSGARVIIAENDFLLGGRLLSERLDIAGAPGVEWARATEAELKSFPGVTIMPRTAVIAAYDGCFVALERASDHLSEPPPFSPRQRLWKIVARHAVIATGAVERGIAFGGNDRPGVMMASAIRTYLNRFAAVPGNNIAIFTATDDGWRTAADLESNGVGIAAIIDTRAEVAPHLVATAKAAETRVFLEAEVARAKGGRALQGIQISVRGGRPFALACDSLGVSGGWNPLLGLTSHLGAKPRWSDDIAAFVPDEPPRGMSVAGAARGQLTLSRALGDGAAAGARAAEAAGFGPARVGVPETSEDAGAMTPCWCVRGSSKFAFVDFQNDVTADDVALAAQEGFRNAEHLKRYTTLGMATDQGKTGAILGQALMAALTGNTMTETG